MPTEKVIIELEVRDEASGKLKAFQKVTRELDRTQGRLVETTSRFNEKTRQYDKINRKTTKT